MYIIYQVTNIVNKKSYIGFTTASKEKRWVDHQSDAKSRAHSYFHRAIRKYGPESFTLTTLKTGKDEEWGLKVEEPYYISMCRTDDSQWGYNLTTGGEGTLGLVRNGHVAWNKGLKTGPLSIKHRVKIGLGLRGNKRSPHSKEAKEKISKAKVGVKGIPRTLVSCIFCKKTGGMNGMKRYHFAKCKEGIRHGH
jgi:group I intron endonuclease